MTPFDKQDETVSSFIAVNYHYTVICASLKPLGKTCGPDRTTRGLKERDSEAREDQDTMTAVYFCEDFFFYLFLYGLLPPSIIKVLRSLACQMAHKETSDLTSINNPRRGNRGLLLGQRWQGTKKICLMSLCFSVNSKQLCLRGLVIVESMLVATLL